MPPPSLTMLLAWAIIIDSRCVPITRGAVIMGTQGVMGARCTRGAHSFGQLRSSQTAPHRKACKQLVIKSPPNDPTDSLQAKALQDLKANKKSMRHFHTQVGSYPTGMALVA